VSWSTRRFRPTDPSPDLSVRATCHPRDLNPQRLGRGPTGDVKGFSAWAMTTATVGIAVEWASVLVLYAGSAVLAYRCALLGVWWVLVAAGEVRRRPATTLKSRRFSTRLTSTAKSAASASGGATRKRPSTWASPRLLAANASDCTSQSSGNRRRSSSVHCHRRARSLWSRTSHHFLCSEYCSIPLRIGQGQFHEHSDGSTACVYAAYPRSS